MNIDPNTTIPDAFTMPTPPASSVAPSTITSPLPRPRRHPLKPGSSRESELIRYLDAGLNNVQLRVDNRFESHTKGAVGVEGYRHFGDVERDLESLVDVVWVSGSPNLQIPYLLTIARMTSEFIPLFPSSPRSTFRILEKLDIAFASLLHGTDMDTGAPLPGFEQGRIMSTTDKVRVKGVVDRTRVVVVRRLGDGVVDEGDAEDAGDVNGSHEDGEKKDSPAHGERKQNDTVHFEGFDDTDTDDEDEDEDEDNWEERGMAKVYERTIGELGDVLGGQPIGIITDE